MPSKPVASMAGKPPKAYGGGGPSEFDVRKSLGINDVSPVPPASKGGTSSMAAPDLAERPKGKGESAEEIAAARRARFDGGGKQIDLNIQETVGASDTQSASIAREEPDTAEATATVSPEIEKVFVSHHSSDRIDGFSDGLKLSGGESEGTQPAPHTEGPQQFSVMRDAGRAESVAARDSLGRKALTAAVADFLTSRTDTHALAIALFGAWGSGKSSFIDFLRKELNARRPKVKFRYAEFNAWKNERVDNIGAALAQSVVTELVSDLSLFDQFCLAIRIAHKRTQRFRKALIEDAQRTGKKVKGAWFDWLAVFGPLVVWPLLTAALLYAVFKGSSVGDMASKGLALTGGAVSAVYSASRVLSKQLLNWFKDLAKDKKFTFKLLPDYSEKLGSFHEMGETLSDLVHLSLAPPTEASREYLMLVVDDLDRCSPDTIKQVFDAVRLVAHIPNVVVLVALDERIAYTAVAKHYAEYGRDPALVARDYLAKVFNVFVTLPTATASSIKNYVRTELFAQAQRPKESSVDDLQSSGPQDSEVPPQPERPPMDLESTSALEVETFAELVDQWGLSNPRELWRLRQTWALLKGVALGEHVSDADVRVWMRHMFFREMFLQGTADQRKAVAGYLRQLPESNLTNSTQDVRVLRLTQATGDIVQGFEDRDPKVMAVLLPAAPYELKTPATK